MTAPHRRAHCGINFRLTALAADVALRTTIVAHVGRQMRFLLRGKLLLLLLVSLLIALNTAPFLHTRLPVRQDLGLGLGLGCHHRIHGVVVLYWTG